MLVPFRLWVACIGNGDVNVIGNASGLPGEAG
jgi:hypothetical protein